MLVKGIASGNLVEVHIMVKRYRTFLVWLPYHLTSVTSLAKFCHTVPNLKPIEMFGYLAVNFIDA